MARILVVEDDHNVGEVTKIALNLIGGHEVELAATMAEAEEFLKSGKFDVILMDGNVDGHNLQDGIKLTKRIREGEFPLNKDAGIINISGTHEMPGAEIKLQKPFGPNDVNGAVERLIQLKAVEALGAQGGAEKDKGQTH